MIENGYIAILTHDTIKMRHPKDQKSIITLYRIIAMKTFELPHFNKVVNKYDIGGYVESLTNIDSNTLNWVDHSARVFDDAFIENGSYLRNHALVYDTARCSKSELSDQCRVHGNAFVENSRVSNMSEVKDNAKILNDTIIKKSARVFNNARIENSIIDIGATAHGNCIIINSDISDVSEIRGDAIIKNCKYKGRVIRETGTYENETLERELNLEVYEEVDESTHKEYMI